MLHSSMVFWTRYHTGEMPADLVPYIMDAPLPPLRKPDGGVKPIAVVESLRRMVSSIAMSRVKAHAKYLHAPFELGVITKAGAETIIHGVRKWVDTLGNNDQYGMLQVNLRNAFNLVSRRVILRETQRHLPEIAPWVKLCYGFRQDLKLWTGSITISSHTRIQQGEPWVPSFSTSHYNLW